jgi:hypothetical protein
VASSPQIPSVPEVTHNGCIRALRPLCFKRLNAGADRNAQNAAERRPPLSATHVLLVACRCWPRKAPDLAGKLWVESPRTKAPASCRPPAGPSFYASREAPSSILRVPPFAVAPFVCPLSHIYPPRVFGQSAFLQGMRRPEPAVGERICMGLSAGGPFPIQSGPGTWPQNAPCEEHRKSSPFGIRQLAKMSPPPILRLAAGTASHRFPPASGKHHGCLLARPAAVVGPPASWLIQSTGNL